MKHLVVFFLLVHPPPHDVGSQKHDHNSERGNHRQKGDSDYETEEVEVNQQRLP